MIQAVSNFFLKSFFYIFLSLSVLSIPTVFTKNDNVAVKNLVDPAKNKIDKDLYHEELNEIQPLIPTPIIQAVVSDQILAKQKKCIWVVHGSFATYFSWYQPGGDFFESVKKSASEKFGQDGFVIQPFKWSGFLSASSRISAATDLSKLILEEYVKDESVEHILIGHSHGGNVNNLCSQMLALLLKKLTEEQLKQSIEKLAKSLHEKSKSEYSRWKKSSKGYFFKNEDIKEVEKHLSDSMTELQDLLNHNEPLKRLRDNYEKQVSIPVKAAWGDVSNKKTECKKLISRNFLLATPVDSKELAPSQETVERTFNLFSYADFIQTILGLYERKYPSSMNNILNISVVFGEPKDAKRFCELKYPCHSDLHATRIGTNLFEIEPLLEKIDRDLYLKNNCLDFYFSKDETNKPQVLNDSVISHQILSVILENAQEALDMFVGC